MQQSVTFLCNSPFRFVLYVGNHADQSAWCSSKEKICFLGKSRQDDWQKELMGTVTRVMENAIPSPNYFTLPHPSSPLKHQTPPSLFALPSSVTGLNFECSCCETLCLTNLQSLVPTRSFTSAIRCRLALSTTVGPWL